MDRESLLLMRLRQAALRASLSSLALVAISCGGFAQDCARNPQAIGTSRVLAVDPAVLPRVGTYQYPQTLPLADHEVVLTFDDGPSPDTTGQVLDALAAQCVLANFFVVGERAKAAPDLVRRAYAEGHSIGTHTQTHADLASLPLADAEKQIQDAIDAANAALGPGEAITPFFRAPYLSVPPDVEDYLVRRKLMLWSIDVDPEDWQPLSPEDVVARILAKLEIQHSGIVLMHDVQPHTAAAIPALLRELKSRGYHIVHVVPGTAVQAAAGD